MGKFITYSATDIGIEKAVNQDCVGIIVNTHPQLTAALGIICDGVGGLQDGEYASATTYKRFIDWFQYELPQLIYEEDFDSVLQNRWMKLIYNHNQYLYEYAKKKGVRMGTTLTALLLYDGKYYTAQVGDSRAYEIAQKCVQLTEDQSFVAREVRQGRLTKDEAKVDARRNILLQSIGYSKNVEPVFTTGNLVEGVCYLLSSDGFYHCVEEDELINGYHSYSMESVEDMKNVTDYFVNIVKERGETDNISVAVMKYV